MLKGKVHRWRGNAADYLLQEVIAMVCVCLFQEEPELKRQMLPKTWYKAGRNIGV